MSTIRFEVQLSEPLLDVPESAELPTQGKTMVEGIINSFPFRAPLEPGGRLRLSQGVRKAAGGRGSVAVEITRVGEEPETRVPEDLEHALGNNTEAQEAWADITPLARRDFVLWITTAKQAKTRRSRIEKACDMLASGKRRVCCFPGLNWLTRDHVTPDETWQRL